MKHESAQAVEASLPCPSLSEGAWLVKTPRGIHTCTLDELDLAFQRGQIDASTPVYTSGMTEWQTLGVMADLDTPPANDTVATPEPSSPRNVAPPARSLPPPPPRQLPPPRANTAAPPPRRLAPPPLADGKSFPPTSTAVFGNAWATINPPGSEPQTGIRHNARVVPFAFRRGFGGVLDFASNLMAHLRDVHPRWAAIGPWVFGAGLSGVFVFALYQLANAPAGPGAHTRSGPAVSYAAASAIPSAREPQPVAAPSALRESLSNGGVARSAPTNATDDGEAIATTRGASMPSDDSADEGGVLRTQDLKFAAGRSERQATSSGRAKAKAKAWSKRAKARAARKARSRRVQGFEE